jgi:hypothetical protein
MERRPEDIDADPDLRLAYIGQQSWDEYCAENGFNFTETGWEEVFMSSGFDPDRIKNQALFQWINTLANGTNMVELLYLSGYTDKTARLAKLDQQDMYLKELRKTANAENN